MNKYRFFNEKDPETGKEAHLHQLFIDGEWKNLTGTTTVLNVLAKPLTWWAAGLACNEFGWTNSKVRIDGKYKIVPIEERIAVATPILEAIKGMTIEEYLKLGDKAYKAHDNFLDKSADAGTELHSQLERYVKRCLEENKGAPIALKDTDDERIKRFIVWANEKVKRFLWSEMYSFDEELWIGGCSDAGAEMNDGHVAILDFKSSKEAYDSHFFQMGGYDTLITKNGGYTAGGEKLFTLEKPITKHIVFPFGSKGKIDFEDDAVDINRQAFKHIVGLYRIKNLKETK